MRDPDLKNKFEEEKTDYVISVKGFKVTMSVIEDKVILAYRKEKGYRADTNDHRYNGVCWFREYFNKDMEEQAKNLESTLQQITKEKLV